MTRGWETGGVDGGRRRTSIRPLRRRTDPSGRLRRILEGSETALGEAVVWVVAAGGGLLISSTRDGGAVGIHLYAGDQRASEFVTSGEELEGLLEALEDIGKDFGLVGPKSDAKGPETGS
jgi:hypothetical protein